MRTIRPASAAVALAVVALSSSIAITASAAPRETAPPGLSTSLAHASMSTHHGTAQGVPGRATRGSRSLNGISYHLGPVMTAGVHVYLIWYGNWAADSATSILPALVTGLSGSAYYNINTTYTNAAGARVPNSVTLSGQTTDAYSQGASNLKDSQIGTVVSSAITSGRLPVDANGLYFVLTSQDVSKSGFLTSYCGWHTHGAISGSDIKYSFVGNPGSNAACSAQTASSPNANVGADAMASVVAHELEETATDPDLNAWYDSKGYENADKCAWTFGTTRTAANGSLANMTLGGRDFLIQRNWVNASGGYCATSY